MAGDSKARTACVLVAHSGLRLQTIIDCLGKDGLRIKDLPEMKIENERIVFSKIPPIVIVRKELSKAGHQYFTFLSEQGCDYLRGYLEERIREGEVNEYLEKLMPPHLLFSLKKEENWGIFNRCCY